MRMASAGNSPASPDSCTAGKWRGHPAPFLYLNYRHPGVRRDDASNKARIPSLSWHLAHSGASITRPVDSRLNQSGGTMRLPVSPKTIQTILLGAAVVAVSFFVSLKTMDWLAPRGTVRAPVLVELPPLPPAPRNSSIIAPVKIALTAIRDAADRGAPRTFAGKAD